MIMGETAEKEQTGAGELEESKPRKEEDAPIKSDDGGPEPRRKKAVRLPGFLQRKSVLFGLAGLLLVGAGGWIFQAGPIGKGKSEKERLHSSSSREAAEDGLRQEHLPRFYIPLPGGGPAQILVVDSSVVWDPISAVRFRKAEVALRDRLYDCLTGLAAKEEEVGENPRLIEDEMSRVFREALRTEALSVKVREVKAF